MTTLEIILTAALVITNLGPVPFIIARQRRKNQIARDIVASGIKHPKNRRFVVTEASQPADD